MKIASQMIPKGIFFEADKDRWRVRLYRNGRVVHRKYHRTLDAALQDWKRAYNSIPELVASTTPSVFAPRSTTFADMMEALCKSATIAA